MSASVVLEQINEDRIREIAREVAREQIEQLRQEIMEGELGRLRRDFNEQMDRVWRVIGELTEAQKRTEARVEELAEAQVRTEQRVGRLEEAVEKLAEAQVRTEQRVGRLEEVVEKLAEAQVRTEQRVGRLEEAVEKLAEAQARTEQRVGRLEEVVEKLAEAQVRTEQRLARVEDRQSQLIGSDLERKYRERAPSYFGRLMRKVRVINWQDIEDDLEKRLTEKEIDEIAWLDILVRGRLRDHPERAEALLAVEVSNVIDSGDVERAERRAALLRKAGWLAIPAVAGNEITQGAFELAEKQRVLVVRDGTRAFWHEALSNVLEKSADSS